MPRDREASSDGETLREDPSPSKDGRPADAGESAPLIELEIVTGPEVGKCIVREKLPITIGSSADADLRVTDGYVSRRHCELLAGEDGSIVLRDEESRNGTFVNGVRVFRIALQPGTEIQVGRTRIRLRFGQGPVANTTLRIRRFGELVGASDAMATAFDALRRVAATNLTCLVLGETGTGKELAARAVHGHSRRPSGPFIVIDCGAISEGLVEDKLFGHERGAFTGAQKEGTGAFEEAAGGTIFLDEVGELPLALQPKLLRVLERREIVRLGSHKTVPVDVRVLAATHRDLPTLASEGKFRQDLYYRLAEASVCLPPLRDRIEDIPFLARHLLEQGDEPPLYLAPEALGAMQRHTWPGNVRELRNVLRRAAATASGSTINGREIENAIGSPAAATAIDSPASTGSFAALPIAEARDAHRRDYLRELLEQHRDDHAAIAHQMGVHIKYARRLMRKYGLIA
jgi:DNA-binding NtrC family response regulator